MKIKLFFLFYFLSTVVYAGEFSLPPANESLVGRVSYTSTSYGDTTASIAERYDLGLNAIVAANPGVKERSVFTSGVSLKLSTQFLLPPVTRKGIVINLPEMRLYFYPDNRGEVLTFPIGIGRIGKTIPITNTSVVRKMTNPTWIPTPSIREYNENQGITLPYSMPPGPDNPLGPYAIYLGIPTFLIHSTIFPESIGRRASFGCIRMNEKDIEQFFPLVTKGIPVTIIDMPVKISWEDNRLYLESHHPLEEHNNPSLDEVVATIQKRLPHDGMTFVNWQLVAYLVENPDGVPHEVGMRLR